MLFQRLFALSTPLRSGASSITSSWYRVPRCVNSQTTAASIIPLAFGLPNCDAISVKSGRSRLPPASTKCLEVSITNGYFPSMEPRRSTSTSAIEARSSCSSAGSISGIPIFVISVRSKRSPARYQREVMGLFPKLL